jgi:hypothetical protein
MRFSEEEQRVIDQTHKELDEQIRRAKRQRFGGESVSLWLFSRESRNIPASSAMSQSTQKKRTVIRHSRKSL